MLQYVEKYEVDDLVKFCLGPRPFVDHWKCYWFSQNFLFALWMLKETMSMFKKYWYRSLVRKEWMVSKTIFICLIFVTGKNEFMSCWIFFNSTFLVYLLAKQCDLFEALFSVWFGLPILFPFERKPGEGCILEMQ